jgi:hypothetical protein
VNVVLNPCCGAAWSAYATFASRIRDEYLHVGPLASLFPPLIGRYRTRNPFDNHAQPFCLRWYWDIDLLELSQFEFFILSLVLLALYRFCFISVSRGPTTRPSIARLLTYWDGGFFFLYDRGMVHRRSLLGGSASVIGNQWTVQVAAKRAFLRRDSSVLIFGGDHRVS